MTVLEFILNVIAVLAVISIAEGLLKLFLRRKQE